MAELRGHALLAEEERRQAPLDEFLLDWAEAVAAPLLGVQGEVELLGAPGLVLPAREKARVGGGGLHDAVESRHHAVDVGVQQYLQGVVLRADPLLFHRHACIITRSFR
jgi:hypothetical protein